MTKEGGGHDNQGSTRLSTELTHMSMFGTTISQLNSPLPSQNILKPCKFTLSYSSPSSKDKDLLILLESTGSFDFVLCPSDIRVLLGVVRATQRPMVRGVVPAEWEGSLYEWGHVIVCVCAHTCVPYVCVCVCSVWCMLCCALLPSA